MKHLLAAATFAVLLAAAPAGAQVANGMSPPGSATAGATPGGSLRDNIFIYAEGPDSILLDRLVAPLGGDVPATSAGIVGEVSFAVTGGTASLTGFGGPGADAVNPVPEPATWAMMLVGFGAVGGVLRSRRKSTVRFA
jgi:hypothetical protein